jgi:hypothetical protein
MSCKQHQTVQALVLLLAGLLSQAELLHRTEQHALLLL